MTSFSSFVRRHFGFVFHVVSPRLQIDTTTISNIKNRATVSHHQKLVSFVTIHYITYLPTTYMQKSSYIDDDEVYLVITNISKRPNIKALILTAAAFDCKAIFVVGQRQFDFENDIPRQFIGQNIMKIVRFDKWHSLVGHLKEQSIRLVGVEIHPRAVNLEHYEGRGKLALLMGNEGQGIHEKHMKDCDDFVIISQFGAGTASLNVYVACSIVLERISQHQRERKKMVLLNR